MSNTLNDKSRESKKLAHQLKGAGHLNLAANRYYYSAFQKTLHFCESNYGYNYQNLNPSQKKGSHHSLINFLSEKISDEKLSNPAKRVTILKFSDISSDYLYLKDMREKADYEKEDVSEEDIQEITRRVEEFDKKYGSMRSIL